MRGEKKKVPTGDRSGRDAQLAGHPRWVSGGVVGGGYWQQCPPHAGLNGPQATAGGPSLITFTLPDAPRPYYRGARRAAPQRAL